MKKIIFLLLFTFSFSKADYLITWLQNSNNGIVFSSICVKNYSFNGSYLTRTLSSDNSTATFPIENAFDINILADYDYVDGACVPQTFSADTLYLSYNDFTFVMAIWGALLSSVIFFGFVKVV